MTRYLIRRVLAALPVLVGIVIVTFILARLIPGDPCKAILGEKASAETCARWTHEKGFDRPIPVQLAIYMGDVVQGKLGDSIRFNRSVVDILIERLPVTIELGTTALILAILVGIPAGIVSSIRRNSATDVGVMMGANLGVSMPVFWLGLMLAYVFALLLKDTPFWLPPTGRLSAGLVATPFYEVYHLQPPPGSISSRLLEFISNFYIFNSIITGNWAVLKDSVSHLILPAMALATIPLAIIARMTRSSMLESMGQDYVRTARAKGLSERSVVYRHVFRNSLLPIVTIIGLQLGILFGGAVLTETIFGLAGVGRMLYEAITARDYPVIQGFTLVIAIGYVLANLAVDLSYAFLDPRIRLD